MRISIFEAVTNALGVALKNFAVILLVSLVTGGVGALIADGVTEVVFKYLEANYAAGDPIRQGQTMLVAATMIALVPMTIWGGVVGSWAAPATIYLWVQEHNKRPASLSGAINYGIDRFPSVLSAHFKAYAAIMVGQVILLPTIVFGLQYAFVDAIATLNREEQRPLYRSGRLTLGRRGQIFRTFALGLLWWLPWQFFGVFYVQEAPWYVMFAGGIVDYSVLAFFDLVMVQYYLSLYQKSDAEAQKDAGAKAEPDKLAGGGGAVGSVDLGHRDRH